MGAEALPPDGGAIWVRCGPAAPLLVDGRRDTHPEPALGPDIQALPIPLRRAAKLRIESGHIRASLDLGRFPERPPHGIEPEDPAWADGRALLQRVEQVWARLRDVEAALADPGQIWQRLAALWRDEATQPPEMDVIVRHAGDMAPTLDRLMRAPRRILRRTRQMVPLARVQEMDRQAMTWLVRQPGDTIAERAGDRQRVQAVTREENFNTLENRVLLSYARLAHAISRAYRERHRTARGARRVADVETFGVRCAALARDLRGRGVAEAGTDATPNFVLQNNAEYRAVWHGWHELLRRHRVRDELWRWQARSWEEFCALSVIVALQSRPGARLIAVSPIVFRADQEAGCWIRHVNPLAVFFLADLGVTVEVSYRVVSHAVLAPFGAAIRLRLGRIDSDAFLARWMIWPIWHATGGLDPSDAREMARLLPLGRPESVAGGITLRPAVEARGAEQVQGDATACFTLGVAGAPLRDGIEQLGRFLAEHVAAGAR